MRLFMDFQMMDNTSRLKLWIPKSSSLIDYFVATKKFFSRHSSHLFPLALVVACSFCRYIIPCFLLEFFRDIIWQCRDIVLLRLSSLRCDMSVLCHDIKTLLQHNLSISAAFEFCRDINFFIATKLIVLQPCSML